MNPPAPHVKPATTEPVSTGKSVTLRVVDGATLPNWPESALTEQDRHCLLYLVPLESPRLRSTLARRLRLRDSLAGGSASHNAGILARDPHFWDYLQQINLTAFEAEIDTRRARHFINRVCGVEGRHELNREAHTAARFFSLIEQPFLAWLFAGETF